MFSCSICSAFPGSDANECPPAEQHLSALLQCLHVQRAHADYTVDNNRVYERRCYSQGKHGFIPIIDDIMTNHACSRCGKPMESENGSQI